MSQIQDSGKSLRTGIGLEPAPEPEKAYTRSAATSESKIWYSKVIGSEEICGELENVMI